MLAKDFRDNARTKLAGKWGTMALITLIEGLIMGALATTFVGDVLVGGPLALGLAGCSLLVARGGDVKIENMFDGFGNFVSSFVLYLTNALLIFLWSLLLIVPGIIKYYSYSMSTFILKDNPQISANEARKASMQMMNGNKWRLFCLHFSFIGWILLSILTLGILMFWITPYIRVSEAEFYENLKGSKVEKREEKEPEKVKPEEVEIKTN